jgi:hypothetical protein
VRCAAPGTAIFCSAFFQRPRQISHRQSPGWHEPVVRAEPDGPDRRVELTTTPRENEPTFLESQTVDIINRTPQCCLLLAKNRSACFLPPRASHSPKVVLLGARPCRVEGAVVRAD